MKIAAVSPLARASALGAPPRGDEVHAPLMRNPYAPPAGSPEDAQDYENGYEYAQELGHAVLMQLQPDQVDRWRTNGRPWIDGMGDAAATLGAGRVRDMLGPMQTKQAHVPWQTSKAARILPGLGAITGAGAGALAAPILGGLAGYHLGDWAQDATNDAADAMHFDTDFRDSWVGPAAGAGAGAVGGALAAPVAGLVGGLAGHGVGTVASHLLNPPNRAGKRASAAPQDTHTMDTPALAIIAHRSKVAGALGTAARVGAPLLAAAAGGLAGHELAGHFPTAGDQLLGQDVSGALDAPWGTGAGPGGSPVVPSPSPAETVEALTAHRNLLDSAMQDNFLSDDELAQLQASGAAATRAGGDVSHLQHIIDGQRQWQSGDGALGAARPMPVFRPSGVPVGQ